MEKKKKVNIKRLTQTALLFAMAVVLMILEGMIPPITALPAGVKLGLSNIIVMYVLFFIGKKDAFTILLLKSGFVFLTRGATAFLMSLSGGILSILVMILLLSLKKVKISYIIISVCASISHNVAQLIVSSILLKSTTTFYYAPVLVISGIVMGVVTGVILKIMLPVMKKLDLKFK